MGALRWPHALAVFVSHRAPFTLDDPVWLDQLYRWGRSMPVPRAIVIVSAHWENAPIAITGGAAGTPLYYDFGGFDPYYYTLKYDTPDAAELTRRLAGILGATTPVHQYLNRGLDHGAFIPLMTMYPAANVPVVQVSMPSLDPRALLTLGEQLRPLRDEGVLVIGSGFMTHSFAVTRHPDLTSRTAAFDEWAVDALTRGDVDALTDYQHKAPAAKIAHPTADHFVPLLLSLGSATDPRSPIGHLHHRSDSSGQLHTVATTAVKSRRVPLASVSRIIARPGQGINATAAITAPAHAGSSRDKLQAAYRGDKPHVLSVPGPPAIRARHPRYRRVVACRPIGWSSACSGAFTHAHGRAELETRAWGGYPLFRALNGSRRFVTYDETKRRKEGAHHDLD